MDENKKKGGFFGKLIKGFGLFLLVIVAVVGAGAAGAWMTGRFDPEKIYIQTLTINGVKEYVTITENDTSYTTKVDYAPAEANQLTLTAKIVTGGSLIEPLGNVVAGQPLELKFVKDENGITKGGEVEIKFVDSAQKAYTTLKVLIDVALDSNYIEIKSNGNEMESQGVNTLSTNVLTTVLEENKHTIKINAEYDEMLNSYKGNWSQSDNNNAVNIDKLKKMLVCYDKNVSVTDIQTSEVKGEENYYLIKYLTPATIENFEMDLYFYRTYFLETVFDEGFALDLINAQKEGNYDRTSFSYEKLNTFINNYVYHNSSVDVRNVYDKFSENGVIVMEPAKYTKNSENFIIAIENTLNYALVHKKILISVDKVEIKNIINLNNTTEIKFPVLQSTEYSIEDVYNKLGISLAGVDETIDKQVLFNTLRDIDIKLCYQTSVDDYNLELESKSTLQEKLDVVNQHYKVGEKYLKIVGQTKFTINKTINEDGSATWKIESLSPTASNDYYYLLFCYEKNDFETTQRITDKGSGAQKEYRFTTADGISAWHYGTEPEFELETLATLNNRKYACTPISVTFANGSVQYNTTKSGGVNVVNNLDTTTVVINEKNTIYVNNTNGEKIRIQHGDEGGVYYKGREMSVGIKTNETDILSNMVIVRPDDPTQTMEYTYVKWFVRYFDNVVGGSDKGFANNNKYYFKPVVNVKYDESGESKKNEIPTPYKLKNITDNTYITDSDGYDEYFMEVGNNDFSLEALNAMPTESPIPLYAVIIQTNIDNTQYIAGRGEVPEVYGQDIEFITLNYISQTSDHTISTTQLIESLDFYFVDEDSKWVNCTSEQNDMAVFNFLDIKQEAQQTLYLTNFILDEDGEISELTTNWLDERNKIVMENAIDLEANKMIALKRYYDDFISNGHCRYDEYDANIEYGAIAPTKIEYDYNIEDTHKHKIKINIENKNPVLIENSYPFTMTVQTSENTLRSKIYTIVSSTGYFQLSKAVVS